MRKAVLRLSASVLVLGLVLGCGSNKASNKNSIKIVDFTKFGLLQFKAGSSIGISGSRYDLDLSKKTVKHYAVGMDSNNYALDKTVTMTAAQAGEINTLLQKIKTQSFGSCSSSVCQKGRNSVWVELPATSPMSYYFSDEGDCTCSSDASNAPTVPYTQFKAVYDKILALF